MRNLIAIEGTDGSGKETQARKLCENLGGEYRSFPNYGSPSSGPVKMYLGGELGTDPVALSPRAVSILFAADRFCSYNSDWRKLLEENKTVVLDRYVGSNAIYQAAKISDVEEKNNFLVWLNNLEFNDCGLPKPTKTIFLNMPPEYSFKLMENRPNKITGNLEKDIHEKNKSYLMAAYENAINVAHFYGWTIIDCVENGRILSVEEISQKVLEAVI